MGSSFFIPGSYYHPEIFKGMGFHAKLAEHFLPFPELTPLFLGGVFGPLPFPVPGIEKEQTLSFHVKDDGPALGKAIGKWGILHGFSPGIVEEHPEKKGRIGGLGSHSRLPTHVDMSTVVSQKVLQIEIGHSSPTENPKG
jgi:hypothetical protein